MGREKVAGIVRMQIWRTNPAILPMLSFGMMVMVIGNGVTTILGLDRTQITKKTIGSWKTTKTLCDQRQAEENRVR